MQNLVWLIISFLFRNVLRRCFSWHNEPKYFSVLLARIQKNFDPPFFHYFKDLLFSFIGDSTTAFNCQDFLNICPLLLQPNQMSKELNIVSKHHLRNWLLLIIKQFPLT